jgi:hypothetical protein
MVEYCPSDSLKSEFTMLLSGTTSHHSIDKPFNYNIDIGVFCLDPCDLAPPMCQLNMMPFWPFFVELQP